MPTEAFYKLQPDKKRVILDAAEQEFSAHSYDKVSVSVSYTHLLYFRFRISS